MPESLAAIPPEAWIVLRLALIAAITWLLVRGMKRLIHRLNERDMLTARGELILRSFGRSVVFVVAGLLALETLGVSTATVWAGLSAIAVMVAVGFIAVWSVLSNALCGLLLLVYAPFRIGDDIELVDLGSLNAIKGRVRDMNLLFVKLDETVGDGSKTFSTQIPNNIFFQRGMRRWARERSTPLVETFTVGANTSEKAASASVDVDAVSD